MRGLAARGSRLSTQSKEVRRAQIERALLLKRSGAVERGADLAPRPRDVDPRLSEAQHSLWLLHQLDRSSAAYNLASAYRVAGELDPTALERAFETIVRRHRLLRSTFEAEGDRVLQAIHADVSVRVERIGAEPGGVARAAASEARKPFDLDTGALIRLLLVEEDAGSERLVVLVLHHILADERSLALLWAELFQAYEERPFSDAATRLQYDDYVYWLNRRVARERAEQIAYWRQRLAPMPGNLALPFERTEPAGTSPRGRLISERLDPALGSRIGGLAATLGTTPFVVLAFAFRLLLQRYTQGENFAFATPASTRTHPATAEMIGYFLNPVVINATIDEGRSVEQAIGAFGREMREDLAHASLAFGTLLDELSPLREADRHPIFQTMFVYQEAHPAPVLAGGRLEPVTLDLGESKFDLTLFVSTNREDGSGETGADLEVAVEYLTDRFDEVWMRKLMAHYASLVGQLIEDLEQPTAEVPMLSDEEAEELGRQARGESIPQADTDSLPRQIHRRTLRSPAAPALIDHQGIVTYAELGDLARRVAAELIERNVGKGDRVGLLLDRSALMIAGLVGCQWAGAAYVPLDPAYPPTRNQQVLEDAEVAAVLSRATLAGRIGAESPLTIQVDDLRVSDTVAHLEAPDIDDQQPAYILYTSGSTGRPKGVVVTHGNLRASTAARFETYGRREERFLLLPSVAFDSSVAGIFGTLAAGGALVIPTDEEARDPAALASLVAEKRVTSLLCVPSLYAHVLEAGRHRLRGLETVIVAGEACPPRLVEAHFRSLPDTRLFNEYGPTEATVWATVHELQASSVDGDEVPIGRPIPGVTVEVLDSLGRRLPAGIPGEGWIFGATVARGYWRRPDLTRGAFVEAGSRVGAIESRWRGFRTGDRLSWTPERQLRFLGRVDEQIKLRGVRIEPGEIEATLVGVAGIEEAAVVARPPGQLVAFVRTSGPLAGLRETLEGSLPAIMIPSRVVELSALPRLPNGKVDREGLRRMSLEEPEPVESERIVSDRERGLLALWESLLHRTGIQVTDNFFQLGGHSLMVVAMTAAIERDFGVTLEPGEVFQRPTVRELAARIDEKSGPGGEAFAHLFPIEPGGDKDPFLFCVPHFFSRMASDRFRDERPVYGLRGVSLRPEGNRGRWRTMEDLGRELVEEIGRRFPERPCVVAGYSFGATMAVEVVRLLEERGLPVERLCLISPMPLDIYRAGPLRLQLDGLRTPVVDLSLGQALGWFARQNHPFGRRLYRWLWRRLAVEPWRRLLCGVGRLRVLAGLELTPRILYADVRLERFRLHAGYRPGVIRTPTVVFNAREPETDAAATWRPYFHGTFTVYPTPDPHLGAESAEAARKMIFDRLGDLESSEGKIS